MPNYTPNYGLKKPLGTENYNVEDQNGNMDIIDAQIKANDDAINSHKTSAVLDHPDSSVTDAKIGNRSINQEISTPYSNTGTLTQILSWFAKVFKRITGKPNWYDAPDITLAETKIHTDDDVRHITAAERTTWNAKETPDGAQAKVNAHASNTKLHVNSAEKLVTDLPSAYPDGINIFSLTTTTSQPWRDAVGLTGSHYAVVETEKSGNYVVQRVTFFYTADGTTKGTYQREGYTSTWRSWKKVAYESELTTEKINLLQANAFAESDPISSYPIGMSLFYVTNSTKSWMGRSSGFMSVETHKTSAGWGIQRLTYYGNTATYEVWQRAIGNNNPATPWGPWVRIDSMGVQSDLTAHIGSGGSAHAMATTSIAGFMSPSQVSKLNGIADGATTAKQGNWSDRTTSIAAGGTFTKTIPLGFAAKRGRFYTANPSNHGSMCSFSTTASDAIFFTWDKTSGVGSSTNQGSSDPGWGAYGRRIRITECYISGNNLVITFTNTDTVSVTLNIGLLAWEVEG